MTSSSLFWPRLSSLVIQAVCIPSPPPERSFLLPCWEKASGRAWRGGRPADQPQYLTPHRWDPWAALWMEVVSQLSTPITRLLPCGWLWKASPRPAHLLHRAITASVSKAGFCFQPLPILKTLPRAWVGEEGEDEGDLEWVGPGWLLRWWEGVTWLFSLHHTHCRLLGSPEWRSH